MGKWREAFEEGRPSFDDRMYGTEYHFGPPATAEELAEAEQVLGRALPAELRSLLSEFNGIRSTTRVIGPDDVGDIVFLSTADYPDVLGYLRDVESDLPKLVRKGKVIFFLAGQRLRRPLWHLRRTHRQMACGHRRPPGPREPGVGGPAA